MEPVIRVTYSAWGLFSQVRKMRRMPPLITALILIKSSCLSNIWVFFFKADYLQWSKTLLGSPNSLFPFTEWKRPFEADSRVHQLQACIHKAVPLGRPWSHFKGVRQKEHVCLSRRRLLQYGLCCRSSVCPAL